MLQLKGTCDYTTYMVEPNTNGSHQSLTVYENGTRS